MNLNTVPLHGRLTDTPRLSHTNQHHLPVAAAVILVNRRVHTSPDHWDDASPNRYRIKAWRQLATNIATLPRGAEVLLVGHVETDTYTDHDGNQHTTETVIVDALGASLAHASLDIHPTRTAQPANQTEHPEWPVNHRPTDRCASGHYSPPPKPQIGSASASGPSPTSAATVADPATSASPQPPSATSPTTSNSRSRRAARRRPAG